jgi:hypothetical protein
VSSNVDPGWDSLSNEGAPRLAAPKTRALVSRVFAVQDLVVLGYLVTIRVLLACADASPTRAAAARPVDAALAVLLVGVAIARVVPGVPGLARALLYRLALVVVLGVSYGSLRDVLPALRPDSVDAWLHAADLGLFGFTPSLVLERWNRPAVTEWFAFFYFSYYAVCVVYMLVFTFALPDGARRDGPGSRIGEFALGTLGLYLVAQLGYVAVPAFGPWIAIEPQFQGPIQGGFWWSLVWRTVHTASAMKDVFPSMHTCGPAWFSCFALVQARRDRRFLPLAIGTAFFAANILVATMFLRWHYLVDVVTGLAMALSAGALVPRLVAREEARRERLGLAPVWPRYDAWWWRRRRAR